MKGQCSMKSFLLYDDCNLRRFPLLLLKNRFIWFWFILCCRWNWLNEQHVLYFAILVVFDQSIGWISRFLKMSKHCTTIEGLWYQTLISTVVFFFVNPILSFGFGRRWTAGALRVGGAGQARLAANQLRQERPRREPAHAADHQLTTEWPPPMWYAFVLHRLLRRSFVVPRSIVILLCVVDSADFFVCFFFKFQALLSAQHRGW